MTDWFTADLHLGHQKVAEHRGFNTTEEHDEMILTNLVTALKHGDRLWVLGDISGGKTEEYALGELYDTRMGYGFELHLISGNHDSIHPMHRKSHVRNEFGFDFVFRSFDSLGTFRHRRDKVMLSHFPYVGDRGTDRYPEYRLNDVGVPIIHGHTHSTVPISRSPKNTLQVCVSLDAWDMKPVSKETLTKMIDMETI